MSYVVVLPGGALASTPFAATCAGTSPTCLIYQNNPAPCATPTVLTAISTTTATVTSTACLSTVGLAATSDGTYSGAFVAWTGISGNTLTGFTENVLNSDTPVADANAVFSQVTYAYGSGTSTPYVYYTQDGFQGYGISTGVYVYGTAGQTTYKTVYGSAAQFLQGVVSNDAVSIDYGTATLNAPQLTIENGDGTTGTCFTAPLELFAAGSAYDPEVYPWTEGAASGICSTASDGHTPGELYLAYHGTNVMTLQPSTNTANFAWTLVTPSVTAMASPSAFATGTTINGSIACTAANSGSTSGCDNGTGVSSINSATGPITLTGSGVSQTGNIITVSSGTAAGAIISNPASGTSQTVTQQDSNFALVNDDSTTTFNAAGIVTTTSYTTPNDSTQMIQHNLGLFGQGFDLGPSGTSAQGWSSGDIQHDEFASAVRGIMQGHTLVFTHTAIGDTAANYDYLDAYGGKVVAADEGVEDTVHQVHQLGYFTGTVSTGGTTGSNLIATTSFACHGYCITQATFQFPDGGMLLDTTKGGATATIASYAQDATNGAMTYTLGSGTVAVSTAWGNIVSSSCTGNGNGQNQAYTSTTCNITLATSPASPGNFVSGTDICLTGTFQEEAAVTAVGTPSAGVQSVTFSTRYAWNAGTTFVMQGGVCGQAFIANPSWPIAYQALGATTSTTLYFSNCVVGGCAGPSTGLILGGPSTGAGGGITRTSDVVTLSGAQNFDSFPVGSTITLTGYTPSDLNGTFTVVSNSLDSFNQSITWAQTGANETSTVNGTVSTAPTTITFYPVAFITGTNGGVAGDAQLATNTVPFATGDSVTGAPTSEYGSTGVYLVQGQTSPVDGGQKSQGFVVQDDGPSNMVYPFAATNDLGSSPSAALMYAVGTYSNDFYFGYRPANNGSIIYVQGGEPVSSNAKPYYIFQDAGSEAGKFGFDPVHSDYTLGGPLLIQGSTACTAANSGSTSGCGSGSSITLQTNGTANSSQTALNLIAGSNVTLTAGASGAVTIAASGGGSGGNIGNLLSYSFDTTGVAGLTAVGSPALTSSNSYTQPDSVNFPSGQNYYEGTLSASSTTIYTRQYINILTEGSTVNSILQLWNSGAEQFSIYLNANNTLSWSNTIAGTTGSADATPLSVGSYNYVEVYWVANASTGNFVIRVNGTTVYTSAAQDTGSAGANAIYFGNVSASSSGWNINMDNVDVGNTGWLGAVTPGGSSTPPLSYEYFRAGLSDGGAAFAGAFTRYDNNQPQVGSVAPATSALGYLLFNASPSAPQYAEVTTVLPPYWTSSGLYLQFYSSSTSGNAVMDVQTACVTANQVVGSPTFTTATTSTTAVSSTANGLVQTALISGIAAPGANGCPATGVTTPTMLTIRVYADATDTVPVYFTGATMVTGRSQ